MLTEGTELPGGQNDDRRNIAVDLVTGRQCCQFYKELLSAF
jgi:hypothetical protein